MVPEIESAPARLVGVHGIAKQHLGRHQLRASWAPALADGLERAGVRLSQPPELEIGFYGDLFLAPSDSRTKGANRAAPLVPEAEADIEPVLVHEVGDRELPDLEDALREAAGPDLDPADFAADKGYTRVPKPLQVLLRAIDRRFGAAAGVLYLGVLRQVWRYLCDPGLKAQVDSRVSAAVEDGCRVLIGHSLGSVVAYEFVRQHPDHKIDLFLTLGSPLGLRMVRERLSAEPLEIPRWVNVRDARDPVTCAGDLGRWWPQLDGEPPVDNGGDAHAAERYLSTGAVGRVILSLLPELP